MDTTLTAAAIATIISAITSASITLYINNSNKKKNIDDQLDTLLKLAIQYPYLESSKFINGWNTNKTLDKEEYLRYDIYCTLLFNFLSRVAEFYNYDRNKIDNYIAAKDWIRLHKEYWINPIEKYENIDSYDDKFKKLIDKYLK